MALSETLGFLGFGNMGGAIARGLLTAGTLSDSQIVVYDVDDARRADAAAMGLAVAESPAALARDVSTLMLAVKPQTVAEAVGDLPSLGAKRVISIAAGVSIGSLHAMLGHEAHIVRVMPNTPALVSTGAAAFALGPTCDSADADLTRAIFEAVGSVELVREAELDAVTALSGSGPAYFFYMVECLVRAAVDEGLTEAQATRLASQTLLGAGRLLSESGEPAGILRERVTSKGGTTAAALAAFQEHGLAAVLAAGVKAAAARSRELGRAN